jgi:PEP-CTERM motif
MTRATPGCFFSLVLLTIVMIVLHGAAPAHATVIDASLDAGKFGRIDQGRTQCPDVGCGAAAAVNSFVYLQTAFPGTYTVPLVPSGKEVDVANTLNGQNFMNTCCVAGGASLGDFILGKMAYIESVNKGVTRYEVQMRDEWSAPGHPGAAKPAFVEDNKIPTVTFIAEQLMAGQDIEISLKPLTGPGHFVTLTGIMFDTDTGTGRISFVDPMGGRTGTAGLTRPGESLVTDYMINDQVTRIVGVVAESPVPEPATVLLLGSGAAAVAVHAWRRHRGARRP